MAHTLPLLVCLLLAAAPARAAENWTYAASEHFEVYTTAGDGTARDALAYFERVHAFFAGFFELAPRSRTPTRLIIFSGERQFAPYRPNEVAAAYYLSGLDRDYIVMESFDEDSNPIVIHEYAHLINKHAGYAYPLWLEEGFADFFSTMQADGKRMNIGLVPDGPLLYLREGEPLLPLERLFAVGHDSAEYNGKQHAGVFYSQSWALTHMIMTDKNYRPGAARFNDMVLKGTSSAEAVESAFGKSLADVLRDLSAYVRRNQYSYYPAEYTSPPRGARIPTRRAEPFEADLVTANLLANSAAREADARSAFQRLYSERPDDLQLVESRAVFELRRGDVDDALPFLAKAVELGSKTPSLYRDYAQVAPDLAPELLAQAVALAPDDPELRLYQASVLLDRDRSGQAYATLAQIKRVPHESAFEYYQLLAMAYLRMEEVQQGKSAAANAAKYAKTDDQASYAARLLASIADYEAAMAAAKERAAQATAAAASAAAAAVTASPATDAVPAPPAIEAAPFSPGTVRGSQPLSVTVNGRIRNMICSSDGPVLEVATATGVLRLLIDNPLAITVQGTPAGTVDLNCGSQDSPIRIGYVPLTDSTRKTVGNVRLLDYRPR